MISAIEVTDKSGIYGKQYGMVIETDSGNYDYTDISECKISVEKLAARLKNGMVSSVHFNDIIRDFIVERAIEKLSANNLL